MPDAQFLTLSQVTQKLKEFGLNEITSSKKHSIIKMFLSEFTDLMVLILIGASIIAILSGKKIDGGVILFIVFLNAIIGFIQEYRADKAIEALQKLVSPKARVLRDQKEQIIDARFVVPGDILLLAEGDKIAADGQILECKNLRINEAILTGESAPVEKKNNGDVFMSTEVTRGTAKVLITKTGMQTQFGKIADLTVNTKKDKSPLEKELFRIGLFVGKITLIISGILFFIGFFIQGKTFIDTLLFAVAVAVAAVPEGLPATITIALALGVQKLAKKNAIVKQLSSVETLGSTTVICSDKTGTLTKNQMAVAELNLNYENKEILEKALNVMFLCNDAKEDNGKFIGDPTEIALLKYALEQKKSLNLDTDGTRIDEIPFDSERKMMSVLYKSRITNHLPNTNVIPVRIGQGGQAGESRITLFTKGAPEKVLENCHFILKNGEKIKLSAEKKQEILKQNETMSGKALGVLALAYSDNFDKKNPETNLIFLGLVGLIDPPREEVPSAIKLAQKAGIKIHIITGDHALTAKAIAEKIGLKAENLITGQDLDKISDLDLQKLLKTNQTIIFARVNPEHKLKITEALKANGEIVAVTGDGVNDAPALKRADIGIAMGITGTDVSKEASNMVLADDSFASIVSAIEEGRKIYENLKKFVFYVFSCNIAELVTVFTAIFLKLPMPLTAVLILAVDLGTDVLPAVAIGVEDAETGIMDKPPRDPKAKIMTKGFVIHFIYLGFLIGFLILGIFFWELKRNGYSFGQEFSRDNLAYLKASTLTFVMLVWIQMVNALNCRSLTVSIFKLGFFKNKFLLISILISIFFVIAIVQIPFFHQYLGTTALNLKEWLIIAGVSLIILVMEEGRKHFIPQSFSSHKESLKLNL